MTNGSDLITGEVRNIPDEITLSGHVIQFPAVDNYGLTKREHFAAMALQGRLASLGEEELFDTDYNDHAECAILAADALIDALNNEALKDK